MPEFPSITALVCGSRDGELFLREQGHVLVPNWSLNALLFFHRSIARIDHVLAGSKSGFDRDALEWAWINEIPATCWPAKWKTGGRKRAEGPIRNSAQLAWLIRITDASSRMCLAFPGEEGTEDMVSKCLRASVPVWLCVVEGRGFRWVSQR